MNSASPSPHVYEREIHPTERTSLSVLASFIPAGARVLDLGCGTGALGKYVASLHPTIFDGLTLSAFEAEAARRHYRRVEVVDLDTADIQTTLGHERYDRIVCADVLEHLKHPARVLTACQALLADDGLLLLSVPNASYCGLIAELMQGEFLYRPEGLLDETHLRFFTRRSLQRFMDGCGWHIQHMTAITRDTHESEFHAPFDQLPPVVARYLLSGPDALTYQHIAVATPVNNGVAASGETTILPPIADIPATPSFARFGIEAYVADENGFSEARKWSTAGQLGLERQSVTLAIPPQPDARKLRLDLADRQGYLRLHKIEVTDSQGNLIWSWSADTQGAGALLHFAHEGLLIQQAPFSQTALVLLHGDDPWLELPIPQVHLADGATRGLNLTIELGWPMSGDYMALVGPVQMAIAEASEARERAELVHAERLGALQRAESRLKAIGAQREAWLEENRLLTGQNLLLEHDIQGLKTHLERIENSTIFRVTRPLVKAKIWLYGEKQHQAMSLPLAQPKAINPTPQRAVDVIVPVYLGLGDTQRCIQSVLAARCNTPWRLVIINDASPDSEITAWLRQIAQEATTAEHIVLLENADNLGFVATVNKGMSLDNNRDVVLLNSDTEVANDWLDRLAQAAYSSDRGGTVTPFSNNATIFSYPRFCEVNDLPPGHTTASLDRFFADNFRGQTQEVPTGVGFCMFIRRDCLQAVGLFDVEHFGKGYGEENDFCRRAAKAGWRNLHALDTFVLHAGGVSFGDSKSARERAAMDTLRRLHPDYESIVHQHVADDPARAYRQRIDLVRAAHRALPVVLAVLHDRGGGTLRHARELATHLHEKAVFFSLTPAGNGNVVLELLGKDEALQLNFELPSGIESLLTTLRQIGVRLLHYHHTIGHDPLMLQLPALLTLPYDVTAHDYYSFCPQISLTDHTNTYCGEKGLSQCHSCLKRSPAPGGVSIEVWREHNSNFLNKARHVLAPSADAARRLARFVPAADVRLAPHTDLVGQELPPPKRQRPLESTTPLRIVVLGALSPIKGADLLEAVALAATRTQAPLEFHLLGYGYRHLTTQPQSRLTVHGPYQEKDLGQLLAWVQPDVVWFPALWPETYSYTLSACLAAGLPVVAPDLGAFPERLSGRAWTWVRPWNQKPQEWVTWFNTQREQLFVGPDPLSSSAPCAVSPNGNTTPFGYDWQYERHYLDRILPTDPHAPLELAFLDTHRPERSATQQAMGNRLKRTTLALIIRLRSATLLSPIAQAVPLRWQSRIKSWLRR